MKVHSLCTHVIVLHFSVRLLTVKRTSTHNDMVTSALLQHVCHQLRRNRRTAFVFLVLTRVREQRDHRRYALCAGNLAGMYHDAQLHKRCVDVAITCIDNVHIVFADGLCDPYRRLSDSIARDIGI